MSNEPTLWDQPTREPHRPATRAEQIERDFWAFHRANPGVLAELRELALSLRRAGHDTYSIKGLFEVLRWKQALRTTGSDTYKLNNNYTALYARLLMDQFPELEGFFRTRARPSTQATDETEDA